MSDSRRSRPPSSGSPDALASFAVPGWIHHLGGWLHRHPRAMIRLGNLETRMIQEAIAERVVDRPIYIAGLARSGTTILLERLAEHPAVGSHRYIDFPLVATPYWWNRWLALVPQTGDRARQRAHNDGIAVTAQSPEAFEEMLWMTFFPTAHDPGRCATLDRRTENPPFARFYDEHIRKLLAVRNRQRYVAKGNYNLVRLGYLHALYPGARFVLAIRDPLWHIASLMKQQALFVRGETAHPRALEHMRRVGHFEFGLDRRAIHVGDDDLAARIASLWRAGEEVAGWAHYWAGLYRHVAATLAADAALREACLIVRYETLCERPAETLAAVYAHCGLGIDSEALARGASRLHFPGYYRPDFSDRERALIEELTGPVAASFGYAGARGGEDGAECRG
ncbi:sulfotransferase family protein [Modicisalibacter radicis]|uniref:sulfotransferase family protein n=1 Tax=Halomonas sp. EAR18 TaxID=2518972 RepID=UPI001443E913|nr:sulfotransferase [Halomonas sp. EAR18]